MSVLRDYLGISRQTMWFGLGIFHAILGTRMLVADLGSSSVAMAIVLFAVAGGMLGWGLHHSRSE
ncbi:hypothetical protein [Halanaeroarchaeum sulfurireducens]|uniref:Acetyltransferase n=1 Tax=Halanaeroarchaeum sulfurireducens TaxID=1604004 RepID=A0A0F7PBA8_9EURY|nr:hypothetical protein [Halanaeroarchaeum sulfurireducens]AKH96919.1 acetyltransferase [Halanaeroarchaeum sulfurireducens]ALG81321.1 acetyltransferase [Halanaeroarchaeum sulfurireducens]